MFCMLIWSVLGIVMYFLCKMLNCIALALYINSEPELKNTFLKTALSRSHVQVNWRLQRHNMENLIMSNFSFLQNVYKCRQLHLFQKAYIVWNGLKKHTNVCCGLLVRLVKGWLEWGHDYLFYEIFVFILYIILNPAIPFLIHERGKTLT